MDTYLNYYYLKISTNINYHPQTFLYLILYICQSSGASPRYRYPAMWCPPHGARCWQPVGYRGGLSEERQAAAPCQTQPVPASSAMDPLQANFLRNGKNHQTDRGGGKKE